MRLIAVLFAACACLALPALAETGAEKGERIARASSEGESGFSDFTVEGEMILFSARGATSTRRFGMRMVENPTDDGSRSLLIFEWPVRVRLAVQHEPYGRVLVFEDVAGNRWDLLGPA